MPKRDFTLQKLKTQFNGTGPGGRILIAVNGNVFDVTHDGKVWLFLTACFLVRSMQSNHVYWSIDLVSSKNYYRRPRIVLLKA